MLGLFGSCVTLGKCLSLSGPEFPHTQNHTLNLPFGSPLVLGSLGWSGEARDRMGVHEVGLCHQKSSLLCSYMLSTPVSSGRGNVEAGSVAQLVER